MQIRPWNVPDDFERIAAIGSTAFWSPLTVEAMLSAEAEGFSPGGIRLRLVATTEGGLVVGYGTVWRRGFDEPGWFMTRVVVDADFRRQGIGTALLSRLEAFARENGATHFESRLKDTDPGWVLFAEARGYTVEGHHLGAKLAVGAFDETPHAAVIDRLGAEGVRFLSMNGPQSDALERSVYELNVLSNRDEPGCENEPFPPFADWRKNMLENPHIPLECFVVAAEGEKALALTFHEWVGTTGNLHTSFTGVAREARGRGLAMAVKLLAVRGAKQLGASWILTGSDSRNEPMLHLNQKLGYVAMPGMYRVYQR